MTFTFSSELVIVIVTDYVNFLTGDRLAGVACGLDSSSGCGTQLLCRHAEGKLGGCFNLSSDWVLPTARTHPGFRWLQEFFHKEQWNIKHSRYHPAVGVPCVGSDSPLPLGICFSVL